MIRRPPRSTQSRSSAASDVYKRQVPHLRPKPDMVIADHVFRQPVVMMRKGDIFFALIPDLELLEEAYESGPARYYLDFVLSGGENRSPAVCFGICLLYTSDA